MFCLVSVQEAGAKAIGVMPSVFFKPSSIEVLIKWLSEVAEAAPALPLYYYHIAIMTGVSFRCVHGSFFFSLSFFRVHGGSCLVVWVVLLSMDTFLEKIDGRVKTFRGLKFTDFDLHMYANCVAFGDGKYDILYGRDEVRLNGCLQHPVLLCNPYCSSFAPRFCRVLATASPGRVGDGRPRVRGVDVQLHGCHVLPDAGRV